MSKCSPEIPNISWIYRRGVLTSITVLILLFSPASKAAETDPKGANTYERVTGDDVDDVRSQWNTLYDTPNYLDGKEANPIVREHLDALKKGRALNVASGEGQNGVFMAKMGFTVDCIDFSEVALQKSRRLALENKVKINTINADLSVWKEKPETYDTIININFHMKSLIPKLKRALKHKGTILYHSYSIDQLKKGLGQGWSQEDLVKKDELKEIFKDFQILYYKEADTGKSATATLIARKP